MQFYKLFVPKQAVGASLVYFDLFNVAGSGYQLNLMSVIPVVSGAVAVTGVVGIDLHLTRTTAVGTSGTAATVEGTDPTAMTFTCMNGSQPINTDKISARLTPSGGATAGAVLGWRCVFGEETNSGAYNAIVDLVRSGYTDIPALPVQPGTGIRVVQGSVAATGNVGFDVVFNLMRRPNP